MLVLEKCKTLRLLQQQLYCEPILLWALGTSSKKPAISQKVKFVDQLKVVTRGGKGGGGASALFGRTGHYARAAGGNGAPGGSVILQASKQLTGLGTIPLHIEATRGGHGGKQWMKGKKGADKVVKVPLGTLLYQLVEYSSSRAKPQGVTAVPAGAAGTPKAVGPRAQAALPKLDTAACSIAQQTEQSGELDRCWQPLQQQAVVDAIEEQQSSVGGISGRTLTARKRLFKEVDQQWQGQQHDGPVKPWQQRQQLDAQQNRTAPQQDWLNNNSSREPLSCHGVIPTGDAVDLLDTHGDVSYTASCGSLSTQVDQQQTDLLYQQLITSQRLLSNAEKLHLLQTGRLLDTADTYAGICIADSAAAAPLVQSNGAHALQDDSADGDVFATEAEDFNKKNDDGEQEGQDIWADSCQLYPADDGEPRTFTKQQVWSILEAQAELLGELNQDGQQLVVAAGGRGGQGNAVSPSKPHGPASRFRTNGEPGQEVLLLLKLRLLADVALVGLPNVGKSSLIAALTGARAQIGSYAFTTLRPQLGSIIDRQARARQHLIGDAAATAASCEAAAADAAAEWSAAAQKVAMAAPPAAASAPAPKTHLVVADLPGLLPGAHAGVGRGTAFLAHLQRARCIALVIDMTGSESPRCAASGQLQADGGPSVEVANSDQNAGHTSEHWSALVPYAPESQLAILLKELQMYDAKVLQLPMVVVANKLDALSQPAAAAALQWLKAVTSLPIFPVSAKHELGLERLKTALQSLVGC